MSWEDEDDMGFTYPEDIYPEFPEDPSGGGFVLPGNGAGPEGPGGDAPGSGGSQFDWSQIARLIAGAGGSGGGGGGGMADILKMLGLSNGGGAGSLLPLLALLAGGGGLINSNNANDKASGRLQDAAKQSNADAERLVGGARADFQPYMQAGTAALPQLQGMVGNSNLAGKFGGPSATAPNLADKFKGAMSLAALARK